MTLILDDGDVQLHHGDTRVVMQTMPAESVQCVVTSPPYWGLRDYGTGRWEGGDADCDHVKSIGGKQGGNGNTLGRDAGHPNRSSLPATGHALIETLYRDTCGKCGAVRVDGQIGLEESPDAFIAALVGVFQDVRRVLRRDGTVWLNLGDSYASTGAGGDTRSGFNERYFGTGNGGKQADTNAQLPGTPRMGNGLKPKDLVGMPWRVALALQADGWWLRSCIIWAKPNPMPESVTDRPTTAHEYVFLLSKAPTYYYDATAVREPHVSKSGSGNGYARPEQISRSGRGQDGAWKPEDYPGGRNLRTVWTINSEPSSFPPTVRRVPVDADAVGDGIERTTSPGCPVHGDHPAPAATDPGDEREAGSPIRTAYTDDRPALGHHDELVCAAPTPDPDRSPGSSGSLHLSSSPAATPHSKGSRRTALGPATSQPYTPSGETSSRTVGTSTPPLTAAPHPGTLENRTSPDALDAHSPDRTAGGTADTLSCSCSYTRSITENVQHFATFPQALVEPCIKAGTSEHGCCSACGAPWTRQIEIGELAPTRAAHDKRAYAPPEGADAGAQGPNRAKDGHRANMAYQRTMTGWSASCRCNADVEPCVVLDPFAGSGTTCLVARRLGRRSIGIDLSAAYLEIAKKRIGQPTLWSTPA